MQKPHFRMFLVTAMFLLTFMFVSTAFAAQPSRDTTFHSGGFYKIKCDGFTATVADSLDGTATVYFDNTGNPITAVINVEVTRTLTNLKTGFTLQAPGHFMVTTDLQTNTSTEVGVVFHITIPSQGIVDLAAGKVVIDAQGNVIFQANPNQPPYTQNDLLICAALS
jgi:hypothetical protein